MQFKTEAEAREFDKAIKAIPIIAVIVFVVVLLPFVVAYDSIKSLVVGE